jgi:hypothetical protein
MLIWGSAGKQVEAGDAGNRACAVCKENRHFRYVVSYTVRHVWYLLRWSTGKSYSVICDTCNCVFPADPPQISDAGVSGGAKPKSPIPAFDRWGWAFALGAIGVLIVIAGISGNADKAEEAKMIAAPKVGDLYTVEMEKFEAGPATPSIGSNFGIVRISAIAGDKVTFQLPKIVSSKMSGTYKEISSGKARRDDYYNATLEKTVSDVAALQKAGAIRDIDR